MDNNGDKQLSKEELKYGLANYGIELNLRELDDIFSVFDRDHNGVVSLDELLVAIKGDMNPRRKALVERAFRSLDKDGSGTITIDEMLSVYDASQHPEVIAGKKSKNEVIREFMRQWDGGDMDGVVTYQEFEDYYKGISASIDGDDYFELMIRNAWRMAGGKGMAANTANKRLLVTNKDGSQQVVTVENELGVRPGDAEGYRRRLAQQGVEGELGMYGGVDTTEKAKSSNRLKLGRSAARKTPEKKGPSLFERNLAAAKVAAAMRGRLVRNKVASERRKLAAEQKLKEDEMLEAQIPRPQRIIRPKGKSYIGF